MENISKLTALKDYFNSRLFPMLKDHEKNFNNAEFASISPQHSSDCVTL